MARTNERSAYIVTYLRAPDHDWPVDVGDDPSFASSAGARVRGGVVTWGVCRQDVRNALRPGDLVVFFAADRLRDRRPARYSFVAFGLVARKVSQEAIWNDSTLELYRGYRNLLIRPRDGGFEHHEPGTSRKTWHKDWLWRIVEKRLLKKGEVLAASEPGYFVPGTRIGNRALVVAQNYILFRSEPSTIVFADPPLVAEADRAGASETWRAKPVAQELRSLLFRPGVRPHLRTSNGHQPHRHITIPNAAEPLLDALTRFCDRHQLEGRRLDQT